MHRLGRIRERAKFEQFIAARLENWRAQWVEEDVAAEKAFKAMDRELKEKEYHWQWKLERRHQKYTLRQKKLQERMRKIQKDIGEDFDTEAFEKANETLRMRRRNSDGRVEVESILHQQEIINRKEEFAAGERERKERQLMALAEHDSDKEWFRIKQMIDLITKYGRFTSERLRIKIERKHMIAALERREKEMQMQHEQEKLDLQTKTRLAERRENKWPKYLLDTDAKRRERQRNIEYFQNIQTRHKLSILSLSTLANFTYETQPDDRRVLLSQYAPILNRIHDLIDVAAKYGYPLILRQVSTMLVNLVSDPTDMSGSSATSYRYGRGLAEKKKNALFDSAEDIEYEQEWEATIELGLSTVGEAIEISRLNTLLCCDDAQTKVIAMLLLKRLTTRKEFAYRLAFCSPIMHLLCNLVEDPASDSILCGHIAGVLMHISNHGSSLSRYLVRPDIIAILGILAEMDYEGMRAKSVPEEEESISHRAYSLSRRQSSSRSSMSSIHGLHIEDEGTTMDDFRADGGKISFKRESMNNRRDRIYSTTKVALSLISHHPVAMASQSAGVKIVFDTLMKASFYLLSIVEPTATQEMFEEDVLENEDENESNWQNLDQFTRIGSESETRFTDIVAKSIEGAVLGSDLCNGEQLHLSAANTILMKDQVVSRMKRYAKVIQSYRKTSLLCPVPEMGREEKQVEIRFYLSLLMGTVQGVAHLMHFHSIQSIIKAVGADLILPIFLLVAPLDPLKNLNSVVPSPRDAALNYHPSRLLEDPIGVFRHSLAVFPLKGYEGRFCLITFSSRIFTYRKRW